MLYVFWAFLNGALFLLLIYLAYHAVRAVRQRFGLVAALLLAVWLLSFSRNPDAKKKTDALPLGQQQANATHQQAFSTVLAKNPVFNTHLTIVCNLAERSASFTPATASSYLTGFITGYNWQSNVAVANFDSAAQSLDYHLHGTLEWKLLGMQVYAQSKDYKGTMPVR